MPLALSAAKARSFSPWLPLLRASMLEDWPGRWLGVSPLTRMLKVCAAMPFLSLAVRVNR